MRERAEIPSDLTIETRLPTLAKYDALIDAVGWRRYTPHERGAEIVAGALAGLIAVSGGETIGLLLVMGDGIANLVVRDVMVRPEFQSRGVGTALLARLDAWIATNAPPASYVTLLCSADRKAFYARIGFVDGGSGLQGMYRWVPPR